MGFSRQEHWNGLPLLTQGDLPDPGPEPTSFASSVLAGGFSTSVTLQEMASVGTYRASSLHPLKSLGQHSAFGEGRGWRLKDLLVSLKIEAEADISGSCQLKDC